MIVIDPYMLAIPGGGDLDKEAVLEYACRLLKWESVLSKKQEYSTSDRASKAIRELGLWPTKDRLHALFDAFNVTEYSAIDIAPTPRGMVANRPSIEEWAELYHSDIFLEVECIKDTEIVIPEEIRARLPVQVAEAFVESLIYACYARRVRQDPTVWSIGTAPLKKKEQLEAEMLLECDIEKLGNDSSIEREKLSQEWPLLFDPEHLYATYNLLEVYGSDPHMAAKIAWCKMKADGKGSNFQGIDPSQFTFGPLFLQSLQQSRIQRRPHLEKDIERVFDAIVYVLENLWSYPSDKHHPLRKSVRSRKSPQLTRKRQDRSGAWRRDKAARIEAIAGANCLHIHYWQCFDGQYEFSNVTDEHDDATIYNGL